MILNQMILNHSQHCYNYIALKLFSKNSNLYDHDTSTSQTDVRTDNSWARPRGAQLLVGYTAPTPSRRLQRLYSCAVAALRYGKAVQMHCQFAAMNCQLHCLYFEIRKKTMSITGLCYCQDPLIGLLAY